MDNNLIPDQQDDLPFYFKPVPVSEEKRNENWNGIISGIDERIISIRSKRRFFISIAATLVILTGATWLYIARDTMPLVAEYKTGYGQLKIIMLPDSTRLFLNANSSVKIPEQWKDEGDRQVSLNLFQFSGGSMLSKTKIMLTLVAMLVGLTAVASAQSTTANISGQVMDEQQKVIPNATVKAREIATNATRTVTSDAEGRYRFPNLSIGSYELSVEAPGFAKLIRTGITLLVNQDAVIDATLKVSTVTEVVTITENASVLNTTNSEVSTRFDEKRLSELPISTNRNVFNVVLSAPGVSQLGSGQTGFAAGVNFSSNGGRVRSNNFIIDGQDSNDPSVSGGAQALNNPDLVQELRLITNQFAPEYGRNSGSVVSVVTKAGTNQYHGSAFWFHNDNHQNSCSNTDKAGKPGGYCNPTATTAYGKVRPSVWKIKLADRLAAP